MYSENSVAVVGAGIFGATIALKLAEEGFKVTLFEKSADILMGASLNNQNRLHLGYHYPRDMDTALQCKKGFDDFIEMFPKCVVGDFPNSYFIAKENSLTNFNEFTKFCDSLGRPYTKLDVNTFPVEVRNVEGGILCDEVVYDVRLLREIIKEQLLQSSVILKLDANVEKIKKKSNGFDLNFNDELKSFDFVINATYADINSFTLKLGYDVQEYQYEYTVVPILRGKFPNCGVTIMDGPFMTILPYGATGDFLLYHVNFSVVERKIGHLLDAEWRGANQGPLKKMNLQKYFEKMITTCKDFIPSLENALVIGYLSGPRMVRANRDQTDERPSLVEAYGRYFTVFSGKVDHCAWVSNQVARNIKAQLKL